MAKRPSVIGNLAIAQDAEQQAEAAATVVQLPQAQAQDARDTPAAPPKTQEKRRKPDERGHTSIYLHKAVRRKIREIAFAADRRPHDILMEGVDLVLQKYGHPTSAEISRKDNL